MKDLGLRASRTKHNAWKPTLRAIIPTRDHVRGDRLCKCVFVEHGRHNSDIEYEQSRGNKDPSTRAKCLQAYKVKSLRFFNNLPSYCKSPYRLREGQRARLGF